jgi:general secretion pathway protein G
MKRTTSETGCVVESGSPSPERSSDGQRGFSFVELYAAVAVLLILAALAIPLTRWGDKRRREVHLKGSLAMIRQAIDQYKKYADEGLIIQSDIEQAGYPLTLDELVDGIEVGDPQSPDAQTIPFLAKIPIDPFTGEADGGMRSYQDDFDSNSWGGENVYDVYSESPMRALDDTYYSEW